MERQLCEMCLDGLDTVWAYTFLFPHLVFWLDWNNFIDTSYRCDYLDYLCVGPACTVGLAFVF